MRPDQRELDSRGLLIAVSAYLLWGAFPLYFALLRAAQPLEIVAHRVAWTNVFCLVGIAVLRGWGQVRAVLVSRRLLTALVGAGVLVTLNWLIYVWAVLNDHVVDLVAERVDVALRVGPLQQTGLVARRVAQVNVVTCASPSYLADRGEPRTPDDLRGHRLLAVKPTGGGSPEWLFPAPWTPRRLKLHFAMQFNAIEGPIIAATAGLGIVHTADLVVAEYVARGELKLILGEYALPGPPVSLVYPSAGHQAPKVRVFSDFAADLLRRWHDIVRAWLNPAAAARTDA